MTRSAAALAVLAALSALAGCASAPVDAATSVDRTSEVRAAVGDTVVSATETEPGRYEIQTSIVDPRGAAGSAEAVDAIAICEAVVKLGATYVSVLEEDGTTFVVYGHPRYGDVCTEI